MDMQGALGIEQLKKFDFIHTGRISAKNKIAAIFQKHLGDMISIPEELGHAETSWFGVPIICLQTGLKEKLVEFLEANRIQTRNYFAGNILQHPGYAHLDNKNKYPNANQVLSKVFFVGCSPNYLDGVFDYYEEVLTKFKGQLL
jgi:CDP-6-deoxy-D-xylo-4-hexulose-3-dehydrase